MSEKNKSIECEEAIDDEDTSCGELITQPFSPSDIRLSTPPMNMGDIIDMIQYDYIKFESDYQRNPNLWDPQQQSRLIESVLLGLRLPAFYFEEVTKKKWRIIDGLQRCCSIKNFCVDKSLTLEGMEFLTQFEGKRYDDFLFDTKRDIRMLPVTVNVLETGVPDQVKYILFKRLNTGGIELKPQEIRNAVYVGKAIDLVKELANDPSFIKVTLGKIPTLRKQDQDFVSRFISFYLRGYKNYTPDLDNFINGVMHDINAGMFNDRITKMKADFRKSMDFSFEIFGNDAFRKREYPGESRKPLNKAYFEVISVSFAHLSDDELGKLLENQANFKSALIYKMHNDRSYNNSVSSGTGKKETVVKRFTVFNDILADYIV